MEERFLPQKGVFLPFPGQLISAQMSCMKTWKSELGAKSSLSWVLIALAGTESVLSPGFPWEPRHPTASFCWRSRMLGASESRYQSQTLLPPPSMERRRDFYFHESYVLLLDSSKPVSALAPCSIHFHPADLIFLKIKIRLFYRQSKNVTYKALKALCDLSTCVLILHFLAFCSHLSLSFLIPPWANPHQVDEWINWQGSIV